MRLFGGKLFLGRLFRPLLWHGPSSLEPEPVDLTAPGLEYTAPSERLHWTGPDNRLHYTANAVRLHFTARDEDR